MQVPDSALTIRGRTARLHLENVAVTDEHAFPGLVHDPSTVNFDITWTAFGKVRHLRPDFSDSSLANDFAGEFRLAKATGSVSGTNHVTGFTFQSAEEDTEVLFAEMGTERNGVFVKATED